jgi:signal transduction histidine kinase/ligand-binding sensor domain-containing protein
MREDILKAFQRPARILVAAFIVLSARHQAWAAAQAPIYSYDAWPVEDVSAPSTVSSMLQSREGYLWMGTYQGLVRYDGVRFTLFDTAHTPGLQNNRITALYQDAEGTLWIGHETGQLSRFQHGQFQPAEPGHGWSGGAIEAIIADARNELWLMNDAGVFFRLRDGCAVECPGGASASRKVAISREKDGRLWMVANGMVATLEDGKLGNFQFPDSGSNNFCDRVASAQDGGLWVLGNGRARKWSGGRWEIEREEIAWNGGPTTTMLETRSGALLIGTLNDGVYMLRPGAESLHFSRTNGLSHDWVRSLCEDHEGNIWIGTGSGVNTLRPRKVRMLNSPDHWQGAIVLSFAVQGDGTAWIGTEGAGLYRYEQGGWTTFNQTSGLANLFVWSVLLTRQGELYVGTWGGGLLVRDGDRFQTPVGLSSITAPVVAMYQGTGDELWIGTTAGLYRYEAGKLTWSAGKEKLVLPDVRAITQGPDGTLWFGMSGGGLGSFKSGRLKQFRKQDGLSSDFVMSLYAESNGALWIGTSEYGLARLKSGKFSTISTEQGLPSLTINQIVDDGAGNLWLGSNRGIFRINKSSLELCADGTTKSVQCSTYGKAEGLTSLTCSGGFQPSACKTPQGLLWFPTSKGLATIDPTKVTSNPVPPPVTIEEIRVDGETVDAKLLSASQREAGREVTLRIPPGKQRFEIRYTGLSFAAPDKVRFRYKLEGLESEWLDAGTKRVAEYSYLRPGDYSFQVIACNNDDVWNQTGASLSFTVLPQFWQTWWFEACSITAGAGAVAGAAALVVRQRGRRKLEQLERQRALERERTRIARDIHDELGASLTRITLLSQSARGELRDHEPAAAEMDQIYTDARDLTRAMDEIVWAVNPKHDTFDSLVTYLGRFAQHYLSAGAIRCRLDVPLHLPSWAITADIRHNVFLAFKEALNNVVKHAQATEVRISLELRASGFILVIADNGKGFDWNAVKMAGPSAAQGVRLASHNGLGNMQRRLEEVGGRCQWSTAPGEGTRVNLVITTLKVNAASLAHVIKTDDNQFGANAL